MKPPRTCCGAPTSKIVRRGFQAEIRSCRAVFSNAVTKTSSPMTAVDSERQARNLKALLGVAKALASEIKLDNLLQVIVAKAAEVMDAERATLFLYDKSRNELWSKTTQRLEINEIRIPLGAGIAGTVAKTRGVINIADAYTDARFDPSFDKQTGYRTRSILCLPLIGNDDGLVGVIQVLNKKDRATFDDMDESLLAGLSDHI